MAFSQSVLFTSFTLPTYASTDSCDIDDYSLSAARVPGDYYDAVKECISAYQRATDANIQHDTAWSDHNPFWLDTSRCPSPSFSDSSSGSSFTCSLLCTPEHRSVDLPIRVYSEDLDITPFSAQFQHLAIKDTLEDLSIPATPLLSTVPLPVQDHFSFEPTISCDDNLVVPATPRLSTINLPEDDSPMEDNMEVNEHGYLFCPPTDEIFIPQRRRILPPPIGTKPPGDEPIRYTVPVQHDQIPYRPRYFFSPEPEPIRQDSLLEVQTVVPFNFDGCDDDGY